MSPALSTSHAVTVYFATFLIVFNRASSIETTLVGSGA